MDPMFGAVSSAMVIGMVLFGILFVAVLVFIIVVIVRNASRARQAGYDPLTMQTEMAARAMNSELLRPAQSIEQRLHELDDLRARGVISAEEYEKARADALKG